MWAALFRRKIIINGEHFFSLVLVYGLNILSSIARCFFLIKTVFFTLGMLLFFFFKIRSAAMWKTVCSAVGPARGAGCNGSWILVTFNTRTWHDDWETLGVLDHWFCAKTGRVFYDYYNIKLLCSSRCFNVQSTVCLKRRQVWGMCQSNVRLSPNAQPRTMPSSCLFLNTKVSIQRVCFRKPIVCRGQPYLSEIDYFYQTNGWILSAPICCS